MQRCGKIHDVESFFAPHMEEYNGLGLVRVRWYIFLATPLTMPVFPPFPSFLPQVSITASHPIQDPSFGQAFH